MAADGDVDESQLVEAATPLWEFLAYAACIYVIGKRRPMQIVSDSMPQNPNAAYGGRGYAQQRANNAQFDCKHWPPHRRANASLTAHQPAHRRSFKVPSQLRRLHSRDGLRPGRAGVPVQHAAPRVAAVALPPARRPGTRAQRLPAGFLRAGRRPLRLAPHRVLRGRRALRHRGVLRRPLWPRLAGNLLPPRPRAAASPCFHFTKLLKPLTHGRPCG